MTQGNCLTKQNRKKIQQSFKLNCIFWMSFVSSVFLGVLHKVKFTFWHSRILMEKPEVYKEK